MVLEVVAARVEREAHCIADKWILKCFRLVNSKTEAVEWKELGSVLFGYEDPLPEVPRLVLHFDEVWLKEHWDRVGKIAQKQMAMLSAMSQLERVRSFGLLIAGYSLKLEAWRVEAEFLLFPVCPLENVYHLEPAYT